MGEEIGEVDVVGASPVAAANAGINPVANVVAGKRAGVPVPVPVPVPVALPVALPVPRIAARMREKSGVQDGELDSSSGKRSSNSIMGGGTDTDISGRSSTTSTPQTPATTSITSTTQPGQQRKFNTTHLPQRLAADLLAASAAGALVAPIITAIDRGIIENASGRRKLGDSLRASAREMVRTPVRFFGGRGFGLVFLLYTGTYLTANLVDTLSTTLHNSPSLAATTAGAPKFAATSAANLALCLYKDKCFAQMYGAATVSTTARPRVPLPTFTLFTIRDCLTIFASFNLPPLLSPSLSTQLSASFQTYISAASVAQFLTPAAVQLVSTPLHLLGLDLFNRPGVPAPERMRRVLRDWGVSCLARMGRIVPAFGVGGVVNRGVRGWGMGIVGRMG